MSWVKIDDGAPEHRKQIEAGALACWLWVCGLAYCNRQKVRDGFIPAAKVPALYPMPNAMRWAARLVEVRLWDEVVGGYVIHDYHDYQPSPEVQSERSARRAEAGRIGGSRSGETRRSRIEAESKQLASGLLPESKQTDEAKTNPDPVPDPEKKEPHASRGPQRRASRMPEGWTPTGADSAWALQRHGWGLERVASEAEQFANRAEAKGERYVNWSKAFRNWLDNSKRFERTPYGAPPAPPRPNRLPATPPETRTTPEERRAAAQRATLTLPLDQPTVTP